jgi:hypothetical protein
MDSDSGENLSEDRRDGWMGRQAAARILSTLFKEQDGLSYG